MHCWVCDDRARKLTAEERRAIVNYLELLKGGEHQSRKVNLRGPVLHPSLSRAWKACAEFFTGTMLNKMGILNTPEQWKKVFLNN